MSVSANGIRKWVDEVAALTTPDRIIYCYGSEEEKQQLTSEALAAGELIELNQQKRPGCYLHRSASHDVARTEQLTFVCTKAHDYGRFELRLDGTNEPTAFQKESVDVEIRHGTGGWPGLFAEGLAEAYLRFKQSEVPAELHMYSNAGHGFGLRASNKGPHAAWPDRFVEWLEVRGLVTGPAK